MTQVLWGPLARLGLAVAAATALADQALKLWLLFVFDLPTRGIVRLTSFLDLVLIWNKGISYGMFQQDGPLGQWALLALVIVAVALLWIWLARSNCRLLAVSLALIIGGAVGNAIDRVAYGAVADFVRLHLDIDCQAVSWLSRVLIEGIKRVTDAPGCDLEWFVFNLADTAIVAGVAGLLYDSVVGRRAAKQP